MADDKQLDVCDRPATSCEGEYTLERTLARRPEAVRIAEGLLSEGASIRDTARLCHMSPRTVMEVRDRMARAAGVDPADSERASLAQVLRRGALLCAETILERASNPAAESTRDLAQAIGIMVPQAELLAGRASLRVGGDCGPTPDQVLREMRDMSQSVVIGPSRASGRAPACETGHWAEFSEAPRPGDADLSDTPASTQPALPQEHTA